MNLRQASVVKTAPRSPDVNKIAFTVVESEEQCPKKLPRAFRRRKSRNDEVIGVLRLDLEPVFRPGVLIRALLLFGDDALQVVFRHRLKEIDAVLLDVIVVANPSGVIRNEDRKSVV